MPTVQIEEEHFTEGEPDLEAPEELAIAEHDEEAQLEDDLDNEDVLEQDVDETVLEETLDALLRSENGDEDDDEAAFDAAAMHDTMTPSDADELDLLEVEDLEDLEESLDRILEQRMASDDREFAFDPLVGAAATIAPPRPRIRTEFVCRSCFLVCSSTQLADMDTFTCHDCIR